jgi:uncharacterized protein YggE
MRLRFLLVALCILTTAQVAATQDINGRRLTVRGKVQVSAKADRARIQFDIKGVGSSLDAAFENARAKLDHLTRKLYAIGLEKENLSTSFFRNEKNFGDKAFLSSKRDYRAIMSVLVTVEKMELLEQIAVAISESSVEQIDGISFELINYTQLRKDAIEKATEAAKEKGKLVAGSLGVQLGEVLEFEEMEPSKIQSSGSRASTFRSGRNPFNAYLPVQADYQSGIFSDDMDFEVEVRIVFAIQTLGPEALSNERR